MRRQIKAKPASAQPCGVTSATARRILQSLERMSSPLAVSILTHTHKYILYIADMHHHLICVSQCYDIYYVAKESVL